MVLVQDTAGPHGKTVFGVADSMAQLGKEFTKTFTVWKRTPGCSPLSCRYLGIVYSFNSNQRPILSSTFGLTTLMGRSPLRKRATSDGAPSWSPISDSSENQAE